MERATFFSPTLELRKAVLDRAKRLLQDAPMHVKQHRLSTGIHENEGHSAKVAFDGSETAVSLIEAATVHEFGGGQVSERSFIRSWFDQNIERLQRESTEAMRAEYQGDLNALPQLATKWGEELRRWISEGAANLAPLAPSTVRHRLEAGLKDGPPLLATGQLVRAIRAMADARYVT